MSSTFSGGTLKSKLVCTGDGADPSAVTDGLDLSEIEAISVWVEASDDATNLGAGALQAWLYNPDSDSATHKWARAPSLDLSMGGNSKTCEASIGMLVAKSNARIAYIPNGFGTGTNVFISGTRRA